MARRIPNRKRGYKTVDRLCGLFLLGSIVGIMYSMVSYANQRDMAEFNSQKTIAVHIDR